MNNRLGELKKTRGNHFLKVLELKNIIKLKTEYGKVKF